MEVNWYGHSCFRLRDKEITIITDPYDKSLGLTLPRIRADVVTVSHDLPDHNAAAAVKGEPVVLRDPGEYEIKGVFITGMASAEGKRTRNRDNTIFVFELDGLNVCHLGDLDHVPAQEQLEALGDVHVLLIPVGGGETINAAEAAEVIRLLEPRVVIPMHYALPGVTGLKLDPVGKFFKEMGLREPVAEASVKITASALPEETQVILLDYRG